jgi:hypothetical protein
MSLASSRARGNYALGVRKSIVGSPVMNAERQDLGNDRGFSSRFTNQSNRVRHLVVWWFRRRRRQAFRDTVGSYGVSSKTMRCASSVTQSRMLY